MSDNETLAFYNRQTEAYMKLTESFENPWLAHLTDHLLPGAHVLDLGCGPGQDGRHLAKAGFVVTAMDASEEMVRQAAMIEGVEARVATFSDLDDVERFDGIWTSFSLLHAPKSDFPGHLDRIHRALKPEGTLVISLKTGDGEERDKLGRFYAYYQDEELKDLLTQAGFTVSRIAHGKAKGMAGTNDPFVVMTAHA